MLYNYMCVWSPRLPQFKVNSSGENPTHIRGASMAKSKIYTQKRWSLADLFPSADGPEMKKAFEEMEKQAAAFEKMRPLLKPDISQKDFMTIIRALEAISRMASRFGNYAGLWFSEDSQNQAALSLVAKTEQLAAEIENRTLFFGLWWKDLDDKAAARLMADSGDYRYWLEEMRHFKKHTLSEPI
jgi:oligoendopeptidase F